MHISVTRPQWVKEITTVSYILTLCMELMQHNPHQNNFPEISDQYFKLGLWKLIWASDFRISLKVKWSLLELELPTGNAQIGAKSSVFHLCDFEIQHMTLKNNGVPLLCNFKFCASFQSHRWIQIGSYSLETLHLGQNWQFLSWVTFKFDRWSWKK